MTTKCYSPGESAESLKSWATKLLDDPSCRILGERLNTFADAWLAERGVSSTETQTALQSQPQETIAYVTRNEEGDRDMLFFDLEEARLYCNPDEEPEALVLAGSALQSQDREDVSRIQFMADEACVFNTWKQEDGSWKYRLEWDHGTEWQTQWFDSPEEAIDHARSTEGEGK